MRPLVLPERFIQNRVRLWMQPFRRPAGKIRHAEGIEQDMAKGIQLALARIFVDECRQHRQLVREIEKNSPTEQQHDEIM